MEKAEKFIQNYTRNCSNEIIGWQKNSLPIYASWLTPDQARRAVEIAREEMIEKSCDYLESIGHKYVIDGLKNCLKK